MSVQHASRFAGMWLVLALAGMPAAAHVPFLEQADYTAERPFVVQDIAQSKALYGWLGTPEDVDFYAMQVSGPVRIYTRSLVPMCAELQKFRVTYALVGPGLPKPAAALPFDLPPDAKARPTLYEQFSGRYYFEGPEFEYEAAVPGEYRMVVWNEAGAMGDYVAVIGRAEKFSAADMWRAAKETVTLRRARELHGTCNVAPPTEASSATARR